MRSVTAFTAACVLVSNMIGTGIFGTTGFLAADLGSAGWILGLWAAGAVFAFLGAACYGELGAMLPRAGGEYAYLRHAYGPLWGFLSGWVSLTIGFSAAIASSAHLFAEYLRQLAPALRPENGGWAATLEHVRGVELAMVWGLTAVHVAGSGPGGAVQRALTVAKVAAMLALIGGGLLLGDGELGRVVRTPDAAGSPALRTALVSFLYVTFSYSGWNAASYLAEEVREPGRSLPRAMLGGAATVGLLYVATNALYLYALPIEELAAPPLEPVGRKTAVALFGTGVGDVFAAVLGVSILGAASAMIWAGPRVYFAMARDGVFPRYFGATGERSGVPARSMVLQSAWISVLVVTGSFAPLVLYTTVALTLFTALAVLAVIVLRHREPERERPFRVPLYPWTPLAFLAASAALLWAAALDRPREAVLGLATAAAGVPFYFLWSRRAARGAGPSPDPNPPT